MKRFGSILFMFCLVLSCQKLKKEPGVEAPDTRSDVPVEEMTVDSAATASDRIHYASDLDYLVDHQGAYAGREKLFEKDQLAERLQGLERFNYEIFLEFWNTETPMVMENSVVHMSGCKAHDCPSSAYDIFIDLENDNINVFHFRNNMMRIYAEKGWIELPEGFAREMEIKKSNAGIGNVDQTKSNYQLEVDPE